MSVLAIHPLQFSHIVWVCMCVGVCTYVCSCLEEEGRQTLALVKEMIDEEFKVS